MNLYVSQGLLDNKTFDSLDALNDEPVEQIGEFCGIKVYVDHTLPDNVVQVTDGKLKVLGSIVLPKS